MIAIVLLSGWPRPITSAAWSSLGRLAAPTGYFNATAALFTIDALIAIALAARRELPGPLRGAAARVRLRRAAARGDRCRAAAGCSRSRSSRWSAIVIVPDRLRVAAAAVSRRRRRAGPVHRLLDVYKSARRARARPRAPRAPGTPRCCCARSCSCSARCSPGASRCVPARRPSAAAPARCSGAVVAAIAVVAVGVGGARGRDPRPSGQLRQAPVARLQPPETTLAPARTSPTSVAAATTSGGWRWTPSSRTRSAASARTTSPTTTSRGVTPARNPRGRTASSCGCSPTPESSASCCSPSSSWRRYRGAARRAGGAGLRGGGGRRRAAAARRLAHPRLGRLVLGVARAERARARVPRHGGGAQLSLAAGRRVVGDRLGRPRLREVGLDPPGRRGAPSPSPWARVR